MNYDSKKVERTREQYPKGTEVTLGNMRDEPRMPGGLKGIVDFVDDACQVHCTWENGSHLALIPGVDSFSILSRPQPEQEQEDGMEAGPEMEMQGP